MITTRRLTALLVSLLLLLSSTACGGGGTNGGSGGADPTAAQTTTAGAQATQAQATQAQTTQEQTTEDVTTEMSGTESPLPGASAPGPFGKFDPPITISWAVSSKAVHQFKDGDTYEDNIWSRMFLDRLGIQLDVSFIADGSSGAFDNKMNMQLAAGDLPDIIRGPGYQFFIQAYEAGYLADITDVFNEYASDYLMECDEKYPSFRASASIDGRRYGIGSLYDTHADAKVLWIRDDWLENLGMEAPKTIEELYDLAYAFTYNDPNQNGVNDTFGLGLHNQLVTANYSTLLGLIGAWGIPGLNHSLYYRNDEGKMTFPYIEPGMKEALRFVQRMYKDGLIDPEFSVKSTAAIDDDIGEGKIGMHFGMQWGTWYPWNIVWQNESVKTRAYHIPTIDGITPKMGIGNPGGAGGVQAINSKCPYPEAIIKLLNVFMDTYNHWADEEKARIYIEDEQFAFSPVGANEPQEPVWGPLLFEAQQKGTSEGLASRLTFHYDKIMGFENGTNTGSDAYGLWGQYKLGGSVQIIMEQYLPNNMLVMDIKGLIIPDSYIDYTSVLEAITLQAFTEIIMGADIDNFDKYVQDWLNAGGQSILDDLDALYPG